MGYHLQIHDNDLRKCAFCPWTGVEYKSFCQHMNNHFRIKPHECKKCGEKFYKRTNLDKHHESLHEKDFEKYSCDLCEFKTYSNNMLHNHKKRKHQRILSNG